MTDTVCRLTSKPFRISEAEKDYCRRNGFPLPSLHPHLRLRQLLTYRNRVYLFNDTCRISGKKILSGFPPERDLQVVDVDVWESDRWNALDHGRPYDFSRPFFDQFFELYQKVPLPNLAVIRSMMENSDYTNGISGAKNCYLVFAASFNEDCLYSRQINNCKNVVDCTCAWTCELCFGCSHVYNCYNCQYAENCFNCTDSAFLFSCQGCRDCYGCANLANKQYCFFNEQLSAEEYKRRRNEIDLGSYTAVEEQKKRFSQFRKQFPVRYITGKLHEGSTGNFLSGTKNCTDCFFCDNVEDLEHCVWISHAKTSFYHCAYGNGSELIYNSVSVGDRAYNVRFCFECWPGPNDVEYSAYTGYGSTSCFGCVGVKKQSYCILNHQYTKAEYLDLLPRIKEHMRSTGEHGQFFPADRSPFAYNISEAKDFFPAPRSEVEALGFRWREEDPYERERPLPIPDNIRDCNPDIVQKHLVCEQTGKRFKLMPAEFNFYRRMSVPLPRIAPLERIQRLGDAIHVGELDSHPCDACGTQLETTYHDGETKVFCESCFQNARI